MRKCMFCQENLTAGNRAREHVMKKSWLMKLGLLNSPIERINRAQYTVVARGQLVPNSMLAGEVCAACNNGWMNDLDQSVEHIILGWASPQDQPFQLSEKDKHNLARWILKTTCTFVFTDSTHRRHITRNVLDAVMYDRLPDGYLCYYTKVKDGWNGVGCNRTDQWIMPECQWLMKLSQSHRLKSTIQYNTIIFGCALVDVRNPLFTLVDAVHSLVFKKGCQVRYRNAFEFQALLDPDYDLAKLPPQEVALLSITVAP